MTKAALRNASTAELIDAIGMRDDIEWIQIDRTERCQITVEAEKADRISGHTYRSAGHYGPEIIIRYRPKEVTSDGR